MATLYVHHKTKDYAEWRKIFDNLTAMRPGFGCTVHQVFQSLSDPNEITILSTWHTANEAKAYGASNELKEGMKNAGVISQPEVMILKEA